MLLLDAKLILTLLLIAPTCLLLKQPAKTNAPSPSLKGNHQLINALAPAASWRNSGTPLPLSNSSWNTIPDSHQWGEHSELGGAPKRGDCTFEMSMDVNESDDKLPWATKRFLREEKKVEGRGGTDFGRESREQETSIGNVKGCWKIRRGDEPRIAKTRRNEDPHLY
ncbi:hypothetical protein BKA70DRAFT_1242720 [Coprinopsis sp. MPI-PUGE-AT-0042]|nr:hypothetical protein BKA70DRAFT_1242720 [Coprinopsis sp. MPI-PUGE-AT-0042]